MNAAVGHYWVVMPAAGAGMRMGVSMAKQYLPLLQSTVIEWALQPFLADGRCRGVVVVLAANDARWARLAVARHPLIQRVQGGTQRADSVRAGLAALSGTAAADEWVLVHDAARPCLHADDLHLLLASLHTDATGGLLATPLADTLKQADGEQRVLRTVPREQLWRALTPQMFRYALLQRALAHAAAQGLAVTDEAAAVEALGERPKLIAARAANPKITLPEDLALAASILTTRLAARGNT